MAKHSKSQLIEIVLPGVAGGNTQQKIQFPDQPYLRKKPIYAIEILTANDMTTSPQGNAVITSAQMKLSYLTLYLTDPQNVQNVGEWIQLAPFALLHPVQNAATDPFTRSRFELVGQTIYWEKCYINIATPFSNVANVAFLLNISFA